MEDIVENSRKYWFPAKTHGWGWGLPSSWQGWLVLTLYIAGMVALPLLVNPEERVAEFLAGVAALTVALLVICWLKGEPPKWRWGNR